MLARTNRERSIGQHKCLHKTLYLEPSSHAAEVGYQQPSALARRTAMTYRDGSTNKTNVNDHEIDILSSTFFPGPLVLPYDELAYDPDYEPQSLESWVKEKDRNAVTKKKKAIYVYAPPEIDTEVNFMREWASPQVRKGANTTTDSTPRPKVEDVIAYLRAFYTTMTVRAFPVPYRFTAWDSSTTGKPSKKKHPDPTSYVGLTTASSTVRIRALQTPSSSSSSSSSSTPAPFTHQLNLDDLLDALIEDLPADAFATILLVKHDLYEGADDDFCMGRAYGGSRVAVVSMGRYDPGLDGVQGIDSEHAWPAAHCAEFVQEEVAKAGRKGSERARKKARREEKDLAGDKKGDEGESGKQDGKAKSSIEEAVATYRLRFKEISECASNELQEIWLSRICRTASHELGHCFGMDHCVYYACIMQGTASLFEDGRQPPYLCPVDLAKLRYATGCTMKEHYEALHAFSEQHSDNAFFAAFGAWLSVRIKELQD